MNILAHLFLSGNNEKIILGNFIGDYIKGKKITQYPEEVALGIRIHREIDYYTDRHGIVKIVNSFYRKKYSKYSGIVTDIVFDHFLTKTWDQFCTIIYDDYVKSRYTILNAQIKFFPGPVLQFYPFFVFNNWLKQYQTLEGIERVLKGMSKRTSLPGEYKYAIKQIQKKDNETEKLFVAFFSDIVSHITTKFGYQITYLQK